MNKEEILLLADTIENSSISDMKFSMSYFCEDISDKYHCGTAGCIAGYTYVLKHGKPKNNEEIPIDILARDILELTNDEADMLFYAERSYDSQMPNNLEEITNTQAVKVLRNFAETGLIKWEDVLPEEFYE
jgi:hypothetical protein